MKPWQRKNLSSGTQMVLELIRAHPSITLKELENKTGMRYGQVSNATLYLGSVGMVWSTFTPNVGRLRIKRWFADQTKMAAWIAEHKPPPEDDEDSPESRAEDVVALGILNRSELELAWSERPLQRLADNARELGLVY